MKSNFGKVLLLHSLTPQEPFLQKFSMVAYSDWWIPTFLMKMLVHGFNVQVHALHKQCKGFLFNCQGVTSTEVNDFGENN